MTIKVTAVKMSARVAHRQSREWTKARTMALLELKSMALPRWIVLAQHLGWHWVFWFLPIFGGVYIVPSSLFFPELCRAVVGEGTLEAPKADTCLADVSRPEATET
ncbi:hypothetical protein CLCR_03201 [Cladophialophora carrionii]|uniref:Uncharacterized protein n=1 Tax=Cladophialophora carrionii TaxID=86049 RepID=A0A1C1D2F2_9EURO|nr:hypothetical protein CLCR_03201 [Cladophialophora carrionii]